MNGFLAIVRHFRAKDWVCISFAFILTVAQVYLDLKVPEYMASITDTLLDNGGPSEVMNEAVGMVSCAVLSLIVGMGITLVIGVISSSYSMYLRRMQFDRVQSFSMEEMGRFSTHSLITRSTNDIKQIQDFIGLSLESMMRAPILAIWALIKISGSNFTWTAVTSVAVVLMLVLVMSVLRKTIPGFKMVQKLTDGINRASSELVEGVRVIRAYNAEEYEGRRFTDANGKLVDNNLRVHRAMSYNVPFNGLIRNCLNMSIYWTGAFIICGTASYEVRLELFSDMIVFSTYALMILNSFRTLTQLFNIMPRASVAAQRINEVMDTAPTVVDGPRKHSGTPGSLVFDNVSFRYPGTNNDSLTGISFSVERGQTLSIIGSTGSGKTTLANLIPRFYDPTSGSVMLDGVDIREYSLESLRRNIGFVSQTNSMLSGTVRENIHYGMDAEISDDVTWGALSIAHGDGFVEDMGGLDSNIVERGRNLSGGQKQRIAIARAVARDPGVFVFDDSFSALDFKTDSGIRRSLRERTSDAIVVIIAQRIGTVMDSDKIIVLDGGRIVGMGTHDELLEDCEVYREIADSQLGVDC